MPSKKLLLKSALAHILQGEANLISSLLEIGVFPYPIAIADPSVQNAISPKSTTAFASLSPWLLINLY